MTKIEEAASDFLARFLPVRRGGYVFMHGDANAMRSSRGRG